MTRFRGYLTTWERRNHDAEAAPAVPGGVSGADGRAGPGRPDARSAFARVGPTAQSIWNWVRHAERDQGVRLNGPTSDEKEELRRLRREVRVLREEKEMLRKAAAWFAEETGSTPRGRSSS